MSDCRLRISTLPSLQCVRLLLPESEQSSELYPNEGGWMASLTHSRKVYERLGPWLFARGPILNERITHGVWRRFSFKMLSLSHCARSTFKRLPAASRQPSFPIVRLPLHSPPALLRALRANSSSRRRDARPSQPVDSTLRVEVGRALSGSLSCACSRF